VAPLEHNGGRSGIDFEHLPSESRHSALENHVRLVVAAMVRAIVFVGGNESIVRANLGHVLCGLGLLSIHEEPVLAGVDCAEILGIGLERRFNLPILDQILHEVRKTARLVASRLSYTIDTP
jgi:hypothetical protein